MHMGSGSAVHTKSRGGSRLFVKGGFELVCMSILHFFLQKKKNLCKSQSAIAINNFFLNSRAEGGF